MWPDYFLITWELTIWKNYQWLMSLRFKPKSQLFGEKDRRRWESIACCPRSVASRRKAEELIKQGLVTVNGQVVRELATTIKSGDKVEVEGQPIYNEERVYYLLNKPRGVISSVTDDKAARRLSTSCPTWRSASTLWTFGLGYIRCFNFDQWWGLLRMKWFIPNEIDKVCRAC